jgi:type IV pilus assembly protein PilQ
MGRAEDYPKEWSRSFTRLEEKAMMRSRKFCRVVVMALITWGSASLVLPAQTPRSSDGPVLLQDLSFNSSSDQTNIAIRASRPFDYTSYYPNPRLFIVDVTGAQSSLEKNFIDLKTNQVEFASVSNIGDGPRPMVRIEFNLARAIQYSLKPEGNNLLLTFRALNPLASESSIKPGKTADGASSQPEVSAQPAVTGELGLNEDSQQIELLLPTASRVSVKHFELQSPNRLVIDVTGSVYRVSKQAVKVDSDLIRKIRFGYGDTEQGKLVRCVFDLSRKTAYSVEPAPGGVLIRFQKSAEVAAVSRKPASPDSAKGETLAPAPVLVPEASQPAAMPSLSGASRPDPLLMAALADLAVPQPVAAPRFSLPEAALTADRLEPKDAQADTSLVSNSLPQWIVPLPPMEMAARRPAALQIAQKTPAPVLFAVTELPAEVVEPEVPVAQPKPAAPEAAPAKVAPLAESKQSQPPAPSQVAALVPQDPQPAIAARAAAAAPAQPVPAAPVVTLPAQAPTSQVITAVQAQQAPKYSGELVSLELKDADLKDFFRLIGELSGLNIVLDPDVKGVLTIFLNDVPWDQALDVVLKNNSLGKQLEGNVLRIASNATLEAEEAQHKRLADARVVAAELQTETRILSYAKAADLSLVLKKVLSPRGDIIVDVRTNAMIISDIPGKFQSIDALIKQLDKKIKQVEIEARVIAANRNFLRDIGVQIGALYGNNSQNKLGGSLPGVFSRTPPPSVTVAPGQGSGATDSLPLISNLGANAPTSSLAFLGGFTNNFLIDVIITAAESRGTAKLISKPKIITQDNIEGFVQQGVKIPVQTTVNNTVSVQFFDFSLKLTVTPQITDEGTIVLKIDIENSTPDFSRQVQNVPTINTQQTKTTVLVNNGGTVVVGGVMIDNEQANTRQVPGFGSIPLIGNLFRNRSLNKQTQELIFFISPKIL